MHTPETVQPVQQTACRYHRKTKHPTCDSQRDCAWVVGKGCQKKTTIRKKSNPVKVHVIVYHVDYAGDEGGMLVDKRNQFKSKYGTYDTGQSGPYGWCDTFKVSNVSKFRRDYKKYWTSQTIPGLRVDVHPDMEHLGRYLDRYT